MAVVTSIITLVIHFFPKTSGLGKPNTLNADAAKSNGSTAAREPGFGKRAGTLVSG